MSFDLAAYLKRISYAGETAPTLETLNALTEAHARSIPFENLDVILNRGIQLSEEALFEKLVTKKRGGYCFEQNSLLLMTLEHLGFDVKPISARVRVRFTSRVPDAPRTHIFLRVEIKGESYLTDVGIGSASLTKSLRLALDVEQETPHDVRRLQKEGSRYYHQVRYGESWLDTCEFTLEEMPFIDREIANWYTSAHPQSHFKTQVIAARALEGGQRISLQNLEVTRRSKNGGAEKQELLGREDFSEVLLHQFGLGLTSDECERLFVFADSERQKLRSL